MKRFILQARTWAFWLLVCAGAVSLASAVIHAPSRSQDFQWSGARLLAHRVDPWRDFLQGDPVHGLIDTQIPNYLPILYILISPLTFLNYHAANWAWAGCNIVFICLSAFLIARFYGIRSAYGTLGVVAAFCASSPARVTVGNGQQGLLVLFLWSLGLLTIGTINKRSAFAVGCSYLKYSFAPAILLYVVMRNGVIRGVRTLVWTMVPLTGASVIVWCWLSKSEQPTGPLKFLLEPLRVAQAGYQPTGDPAQTFMDLMEYLLGGGPVGTPLLTTVSFVSAILLNAAVLLPAIRAAKSMPDPIDRIGWPLALTTMLGFTLYKHHPYDEVVFLFAGCYSWSRRKSNAAKATLFLISYCWFVQPSVDLRVRFSIAWSIARITILFSLMLCCFRIPLEADAHDRGFPDQVESNAVGRQPTYKQGRTNNLQTE